MQNFFPDSLAEVRGRVVLGVVVRERDRERGRGIISSSVSPEGGRSMIRLPVCLSSDRATLEPVFKLRVISFV